MIEWVTVFIRFVQVCALLNTEIPSQLPGHSRRRVSNHRPLSPRGSTMSSILPLGTSDCWRNLSISHESWLSKGPWKPTLGLAHVPFVDFLSYLLAKVKYSLSLSVEVCVLLFLLVVTKPRGDSGNHQDNYI